MNELKWDLVAEILYPQIVWVVLVQFLQKVDLAAGREGFLLVKMALMIQLSTNIFDSQLAGVLSVFRKDPIIPED